MSESITPIGATIPGVSHHLSRQNGTELHYVSAGETGSPILLVHGFPETWWAFHRLIPLLARTHRVFAIDLPGLGDSGNADGAYDSGTTAERIHSLIEELALGPVHISGQDISGATVFRLASTHPEDVLSVTAIETGLPGFGWEALADVAHGGAWYIGLMAAPGMTELLLAGHERDFINRVGFPALTAVKGSVTEADVDEFVRTYSRPHGFRGATGLYNSLLTERDEIQRLAKVSPISAPVLAIGAGGGEFTFSTMTRAVAGQVESVRLSGVGHYPALEAPELLSSAMLAFFDRPTFDGFQ